jgi:hypothetical protein
MPEILEEAPKTFDTRLAGAAEKLKKQATAQVDTNIEPQPQVAPDPEPAKPVAVAEPAKEPEPNEKSQGTKPPSTENVEAPELSWDDSTPATQPTTDVSFEKIGSALKLEGIKSETELVAKFNEINTELAQYKEKVQALSNIPEELRDVLSDPAKRNDWKSYVHPIDYSKVDPVVLYEHEASKLPQFRNPDGSINQEKLDAVLDTIPETTKELEGSRIAQQKHSEQIQFRQQQQAIARQRKEAQDRELAEAAKDLSKLFPVEQFGIKWENKHAEQMYKGISDGSLLQKHFLKSDGSYDMRKAMATIAKAEYAEKMLKHVASKATVATKKEIFKENSNIQLQSSSTSAAPEALNEKPLSPAEKVMKWRESQQGLK